MASGEVATITRKSGGGKRRDETETDEWREDNRRDEDVVIIIICILIHKYKMSGGMIAAVICVQLISVQQNTNQTYVRQMCTKGWLNSLFYFFFVYYVVCVLASGINGISRRLG